MTDVSVTLCDLRAAHVLVKAAILGQIDALECQMETCLCPDGRGFFTRRGNPRLGPWAPSADRWPTPGRDGGKYESDNVRLAHAECNVAAGRAVGKATLQARYGADWHAMGGRTTSPKARAARAKNARNIPYEARTRSSRRNLERANAVVDRSAAGRIGGVVGMCARWNIGRGKPCVCGRHMEG